ncbi:unnamed protein product [Didymodactylos carnosus]|uniref:N-acetyltransferase domain-containing protein n=1 Tax=Didymodactylos carnosus TaxID=1234261 RepID=A0A814YI14_9BILA|nr:unnamed protein product [Didymodactylos carnosus]CAF1230983.1 unnamed protein product [Didymodactylos carnosus]CAF3993637.1 unnamed protein product [Didymodactylos carnosus]CAF4020187.1 unnamed protein product [Didymodactylos carnosus]
MAQTSPVDDHSSSMIEQPVGDIVSDCTSRARPDANPEHHRLQGRYCRLELLNSNTSSTTIKQLYDAFKPMEQTHFTYLAYGPFETVDQFVEFIRKKELPSSNTILYSIIVNDRAVGFLSYLRIKEHQATIEIGHVNFSQQLVHTRQGTEAIYLLLQHAFDTLGYRRVEWQCYSLNANSRKAALRLGFQYEGTWLKAWICKGRSRDNVWHSIVDDEWPLVKQEFERWLNEDNFDANGQQLTRLNAAQVNPRRNKLSA